MLLALLLVLALAAPAQTSRPVDPGLYPAGSWAFPLTTDAQRSLYLKGGFNMISHFSSNIEWGARQNMLFVGSVTRAGLPPEINPPFESADGTKYGALGPFTHVNFNTPAVEEWWKKRVPQAVREMQETGRVAFWKVHNEFSYSPLRPFDYSEPNVAAYRRWLERRYPSIGELNRQWRTNFASFAAVDPPRTDLMQQLTNWLEWRRYTAWSLPNYYATTGDLIRSVVPNAKVSSNFYPSPPLQGWDHFQIAKLTDFVALDLYEVGKWPRLLEYMDLGRSAGTAYRKPFVMLEYHGGPNDWVPLVTGRDIAIELNTSLARESRALMWYMWRPAPAAGEEGIHGLLDLAGQPTERYTAAAEGTALTSRLAPLLAISRTKAEVAILITEDNGLFNYAKGERPAARKQPWSNLGHILNAARIGWDFLDTASVADVDLQKYKVVILADLPILSDEALRRIDAYVQGGGTVIAHPDVALRDGLGNPRNQAAEFTAAVTATGLWRVRTRASGGGEIVTAAVGKGRRISCAWEIPGAADTPDEAGKRGGYVPAALRERDLAPDRLEERAAAYAALLKGAGVEPGMTIEGAPANAEFDARRLEAGGVTMLFFTWIGKTAVTKEGPGRKSSGIAPLRNVTVTVPGVAPVGDALLVRRALGSVARLPLTRAGGGVRFTVPEIDPDAIVLLGGGYQPVIGLDAPKALHPGDTFTATVTVDNLDGVPVAGAAKLQVPAGWQASPTKAATFANLAPGKRASVAFRVTIPADAKIDRFALDYPLTGEVEFTAGRSGKLSVRHLPFVKPPLDVILTHRGEILNPWQQVTPPVLRWGYTNEVRTPPPPPVPVRAPGEAVLEVSNASSLTGQKLTLAVAGPGSPKVEVVNGPVTLTGQPQSIPVRFALDGAGQHRLTALAGSRTATADFPAGVDESSARVALAARPPQPPAGWTAVARMGVASRDAGAVGLPVQAKLTLPEAQARRTVLFDATGQAVAAEFSPAGVRWAADVPRDGVAMYVLAAGPDGAAPPRPSRVRAETNGDRVIVRGDNYSVAFHRAQAQTEWIEIQGRRMFPQPSHWVVEGGSGAWTLDSGGTLKLAESPVEVSVELDRPVTAAGETLRVREKWVFQAQYAAVTIGLRNATKKPIQITRAAYRWGLDPAVLTHWSRALASGDEASGQLPAGVTGAANVRIMDWRDGQGSGLALKFGRSVPVNWNGTTFAYPLTIRHEAGGTEIHIVDAARVDPIPGDAVFVEFELWPHGAAPAVTTRPVAAVHTEVVR